MIKIAFLGILVMGFGALGYFGEKFMRPVAAPSAAQYGTTEKKILLFKLPLGKFTMQVSQPGATLHHVFDIDVYVSGAQSFQKINGAVGQAKLRDATIAAIAELAETDPALSAPLEGEKKQAELAEQIVRKLYVTFPVIRTARLKSYSVSQTMLN